MKEKENIPTYDQAVEALKNGDHEILEKALFAFDLDDGYYIEQVAKVINSLLERSDLTPEQAAGIKRALYGLGRLPLRTPGLYIEISLVDQFNKSATSYEFYISSDQVITTSGGYSAFEGGTDTFSNITFEVRNGIREYDGFLITVEEWPNMFGEMKAAELTVTDLSDESILDLSHPDGSEFWQWIAKHD